MLIWKCGRSCATHDPAGVERWVSVIAKYHAAVMNIAKKTASKAYILGSNPIFALCFSINLLFFAFIPLNAHLNLF
jgi:hypothetical protein